MRNLRSLPLAIVGLLVVPAAAFGAEAKKIGQDENVTQAMFVLIAAIVLLLGIAVWFESRKEY
jgi:membrane protein DedA with SNARE-associated domain